MFQSISRWKAINSLALLVLGVAPYAAYLTYHTANPASSGQTGWGMEEWLTSAWALSNLMLLAYFNFTRKTLESVITEHTETRKAQNQAKKDLESLLNGVPYMLGYWDHTLHNRFSNKAYAQWLGITPESLLNKHISEFLNPTRLATAMPLLNKALQGIRCEYTVQLKQQGPEKPSHLLVQYLPDVINGEVAGFYTIGQDISERFESEQKLAMRQKLLQLTGEIGRVGGIFIDPGNGTVNLTQEAQFVLHTQCAQYPSVAQFCENHVEASQAQEVRSALLSALDLKSKFSIEFGTAGEANHWLRCLGEPVAIQGKPSYLICLMDMTESHQAKMQLIQAKQFSDKTNEMKSRFVATMSHEIRNPLHAMVGLCNLLDDHCATDTQKDLASKLKTCSNDLVELLNNTLDAFKLARGEMEFEQIAFDLWGLSANVSDYLYGCAGQKSLALRVRIEPNTPRHWLGDPFRLKQIINNLISNASKFTAHGEIEVRFSQAPEGLLGIEVRDTGMGIPEESIDQLFSDHAQGSAPTARLYGGSGLGLSLVKKLVEHMGGAIDLRSEEGRGTCVNLRLPLPLAPSIKDIIEGKPSQVYVKIGTGSAQRSVLEMLATMGVPATTTDEDTPKDEMDWVITDNPAWAMQAVQNHALKHCLVMPHANGNSMQPTGGESLKQIQWIQGPLHPLALSKWFDFSQNIAIEQACPPTTTALSPTGSKDDDQLWVLIAEDVTMSRVVMRELLKKRGVHCLEAENGQAAVEHMLNHGKRIDFVFMDINMPVMNGSDATAAIRDNEQLKDLTIYALTGEDEQNTEQCKDWSIFDQVFKKPMRFDKLEELLKKHRVR
jgi:two-component system, sensor histidine kinase and response regulator